MLDAKSKIVESDIFGECSSLIRGSLNLPKL